MKIPKFYVQVFDGRVRKDDLYWNHVAQQWVSVNDYKDDDEKPGIGEFVNSFHAIARRASDFKRKTKSIPRRVPSNRTRSD